MFELTGSHISKLGEEDLRALVTQLCVAELRRCGLPTSAITAGGHQNAPDGGIDVRVDLAVQSPCLDFVPKAVTGFQVKCSDMPASKITQEMRPDGELRQSIRDLAASHGAYVIVGSQGSVADSALQERRSAMRKAVADVSVGSTIHVDFYDRERLTNWVRGYTGVGLWLRERIGEPLSGWQGYGNWAYADKENSEFLLDSSGRIVSRQSHSHEPQTIEQGIATMRAILAQPGGIVRLVGLSGVGKTRLVQALFDRRIGSDALDSAIVAYTDQGHEPNPTARDMLHRLRTSGSRAIVVVDNCNPSTHRALAEIVSTHSTALSLISIEYDIADDEPEETQVFRLEPASDKVLTEILQRLAPQVSQTDRHGIVEFSGGNARIALALANTLQHGESLGSLNDTVLFERLFHQKQESGEALMRAAEVCSLVYSFDGETLEGDAAELPVLARLADISVKDLYRHIEVLRARGLVQRRSRWRAVLPPAIANRLSSQALKHIPSSLIPQAFTQQGLKRLLKSFSRRIGYLHDCDPARKIAEGWLNDPDWLANPARLNELGLTLFHNIVPLAPNLALQIIEKAASGEEGAAFLSPSAPNRWRWTALVRSLAYEPELFDRAALLLARFYAEELKNNNHNSARDAFTELFQLYLSGTRAPTGQRLALIRHLLNSDNPRLQGCALDALDSMLEAWHFSSSNDFSFGARSRDFGWEPKTNQELIAWFRAAVALAQELALPSSPHHQQIRAVLARRFRGLWTQAGIPDDLERLAKDLNAIDGWPDGWIAIRTTLRFDAKSTHPELVRRLRTLETDLRPQDLVRRVRTYVLSRSFGNFDFLDAESEDNSASGISAAIERTTQKIEELGRQVAAAPDVLQQLLPDLLRRGRGHAQHWPFGRGLALGAADLWVIWQQFRNELAALPENERDVSVIRGYINAAAHRDPDTAGRFLDEAVADPVLGPYFPALQASTAIDESGVQRILAAITHQLAPVWQYQHLGFGRVSDAISIAAYKRILLGVADLPAGFAVAVDLLAMRFRSLKSENLELDAETLALGRELLLRIDFHSNDENLAYHLNELATICLRGADAHDVAVRLGENLDQALSDYRTSAWRYGELLITLFQLQPAVALNALVQGKGRGPRRSLASSFSGHMDSPVNSAPPEILLPWVDEEPVDRYPMLAREVRLFEKGHEPIWSTLALRLLEQAPDRNSVLEGFSERLRPTSWSGSLADAHVPYLELVRQLGNHSDPTVIKWVTREVSNLTQRIEIERQRDRRADESFE